MKKASLVSVLALSLNLLIFSGSGWAQDASPSEHTDDIFDQLTGQIDDITAWEGPAGCLTLSQFTEEHLANRLADEFNVHISENSEPFSKGFLIYLLSFFKAMQPEHEKPITITRTAQEGADLVRKSIDSDSGNINLSFTNDAIRNVITEQFQQAIENYRQAKLNPETPPTKRVTLSFNNTLFEKLTAQLVSKKRIGKLIQEQYGVELRKHNGARGFNQPEATMLLKSLVDLPKSVVHGLALKGIVRLPRGEKFDPTPDHTQPVAIYNPWSKEIYVSDDMFALTGEQSPEGAFLHEVGHGLWYALSPETKDAFSKLSWELKEGEWVPQDGASNFISDYAAKNQREDFAEHFSAFMNKSVLLKERASDKWEFIKNRFFPHTDYFAMTHANAQVHIESKCPDTTPPSVDGELSDLFQVLSRTDNEDGSMEMVAQLTGILDDLSGVSDVSIHLTGENTGRGLSLDFNDACLIDKEAGTFQRTFQTEEKTFWALDPSQMGKSGGPFSTDTYKISALSARDKTGNQIHRAITSDERTFDFVAIAKETKKRPAEIGALINDMENRGPIQILPLEQEIPNIFRVRLPLPHFEDLDAIDIYWHSPKNQWGFSTRADIFRSHPSDDFIEFDIKFHDESRPDTISLSSISVQLHPTDEYPFETFNASIAEDHEPQIIIAPSLTSQTPQSDPTIDINEMEIDVKYENEEQNQRGGDTTIEIKVPIENIAPDHSIEIRVRIKDPLDATREGTGYFNKYSRGRIETHDGKKYYVVPVDLPPNHRRGTYHIDTIRVYDGAPPQPQIEGVNVNREHERLYHHGIGERGIGRSFNIQDIEN